MRNEISGIRSTLIVFALALTAGTALAQDDPGETPGGTGRGVYRARSVAARPQIALVPPEVRH